jgi:xanthine dehydrogenase YagR molybdenum-binding subunit
VRAVAFRLGRSDFPAAPPHGGSTTTGSVGPAVHAACVAVRQKALESALRSPASPLYGASADDVAASDGRLFLRDDAARGESYARIAGRLGAPLDAAAKSAPGEERQKFSMHAFGAIFAEVVVDPVVRTIRVSRIVGTYAAGRIINPKLARSQCTGGMIGGIGMALLERTILDPRDGRIANASLAEYLVPVNLDIGSLEVSFLDEEDPYVNPLGAKGLGEIALIGTAPAIANAVYHATGRRVRELPIRTEHLLQENA